MPFTLPAKDPTSLKDYGFDWSLWLAGDTIQNSSWTQAQATGSALALSNPSFSATATKVWLSGGTEGQTYTLINTVTTFGGRTETRRGTVRVKKL